MTETRGQASVYRTSVNTFLSQTHLFCQQTHITLNAIASCSIRSPIYLKRYGAFTHSVCDC